MKALMAPDAQFVLISEVRNRLIEEGCAMKGALVWQPIVVRNGGKARMAVYGDHFEVRPLKAPGRTWRSGPNPRPETLVRACLRAVDEDAAYRKR